MNTANPVVMSAFYDIAQLGCVGAWIMLEHYARGFAQKANKLFGLAGT